MSASPVILLKVLCFRESVGDEEVWVAFSLERDICAQGETSLDAVRDLQVVIGAELQLDKDYYHSTEPLSRIKPAPQKYWEMWERAKAPRHDSFTAEGFLISLSIRTI